MTELRAGSIAVELDTGRVLLVLSDPRPAPALASELADLPRGAREQIEHYADRRGVSLRAARAELGWKAPPPMWGPGSQDEQLRTEVLVRGRTGDPHWCDASLLGSYAGWCRHLLTLELLGAGQLELLGAGEKTEGSIGADQRQ